MLKRDIADLLNTFWSLNTNAFIAFIIVVVGIVLNLNVDSIMFLNVKLAISHNTFMGEELPKT